MKKIYKLGLLAMASVLLLGACSFGGDKKTDSSKDGAKEEKVLRVAIGSEPPTMDPQLATDNISGALIRSVFEGLYEYGEDGEMTPAVAESYELSDDKLTYTFKLREDAKWTNGDNVVAGDFEYAWKRALNPDTASEYASLLFPVAGAEEYNTGAAKAEDVKIKATDDYTLEVTLKNPTPYFLELTAFYTLMPVNQKAVEGNAKWATEADDAYVTNGPFKLSKWEHSASIELVKNDTYWDKEHVNLDKVNMAMIESEATVARNFESDELDFIGSPFSVVPLDSIPTYKEEGILQESKYAAIYWYKVNTTKGYEKNANIRKALALAIDRQGLSDNILKAGQKPALGMVPPTVEGFEKDRGYFKDNDIEKAKEYLAKGMEELGIKDASEIKFNISINTSEAHAAIAQFIQEGWQKNLGVSATIENSEWQVYLDKLNSLDYEGVARMGWIADYNDAYTFLDQYRTADTGNNQTGWGNEQYKALLDQAQAETDTAKRTELLQQAEAIIMDEMPVIPIYYYVNSYAAKDYVKNMKPNGLGHINLKLVDIEK